MQSGTETIGTTSAGLPIDRIILAAGDLKASILTLGAALQGVWLAGVAHSLTIGSEDAALYETTMRHHGTLIGPVANRITGSAASIGGVLHQFVPEAGSAMILHSGPAGTQRKVWAVIDRSDAHVTLGLTLPDGEGGFPGNRLVRATYSVVAPATLRLEIAVTTDRATLVNFANHSYWNLDGSASWAGHRLRIAAEHYLPTTEAVTPTGEIAAVAGTAFDFREERVAEPGAPPLDTNFCLANARRALTEALVLTGKSGVRMTVATTEPGVQLYDGRSAYRGLAIEPQLWPDAPGRAGFPPIDLAPGEVYAPVTEWRFDRV
ncbi:aldose epimerase family protein [Tabrizicola sp. BL-A-41-H6]|uniref:aldose epimerase family protein n=1 Tax=Tabrizicola sp. BL-A-41-H6 TaxID=3421107 RepID=UPI003D671DC1